MQTILFVRPGGRLSLWRSNSLRRFRLPVVNARDDKRKWPAAVDFVLNALPALPNTPIPPSLCRVISEGRGWLARKPHCASLPPQEENPVTRLLALLWHEQVEVRRAAAAALPGGDHLAPRRPRYSHFVGSFLRLLHRQQETLPFTPQARYEAVCDTLYQLLRQNLDELRGLLNMNYSFLSSALYLAVLFTCRDVVEAIGRLVVTAAHTELCHLLDCLAHKRAQRRLNAEDMEALTHTAGHTLACLPPEAIPDFWQTLAHAPLPRRLALRPVLSQIEDRNAVPFLLNALHGQSVPVTLAITLCLGKLEDVRALSALTPLTRSQDRQIRAQALSAVAAIERANIGHPARELLRVPDNAPEEGSLLRPTPLPPTDPPEELLRVSAGTFPVQER